MLKIIAGKPGTGKTYYMMSLLVDMIADWLRYEKKHEKPFDSVICTNIQVNIDGLNLTLSDRLGFEADASKYVQYLDETFFHDLNKIFWWEKFPTKSIIVIDEVHHYLGKKVEYGELDLEESLINYLSMHRHQQQDLYFLSQHTDNFAKQILGIADTLLEIVNAKNLFLPFPISIPLEDIDVIKASFGIKAQYFQANIGTYRGKAVRWNGASTRHVMTEEIFRVYKSLTKTNGEQVTGDRPSLEMSPFESIWWFTKRHAWHIVPKLATLIFVPYLALTLFTELPKRLMSRMIQKQSQTKTVEKSSEKTEKPSDKPEKAREPAPNPEAKQLEQSLNRTITDLTSKAADLAAKLEASEKERTANGEIVGLYDGGVILANKRTIKVGEPLEFKGRRRCLCDVDVKTACVTLDEETVQF